MAPRFRTDRYNETILKLRRALRKLEGTDGRIARRNARRAALGALRSVRLAIDAEHPSIAKPKPVAASEKSAEDVRLERAARSARWRVIEKAAGERTRYEWDPVAAEAFVAHAMAALHPSGRVPEISLRPLSRCRIGEAVGANRGSKLAPEIGIHEGISGPVRWCVLLHEIAHFADRSDRYDPLPTKRHHNSRFATAFLDVYRLWLAYPKRDLVRLSREEVDDLVRERFRQRREAARARRSDG